MRPRGPRPSERHRSAGIHPHHGGAGARRRRVEGAHREAGARGLRPEPVGRPGPRPAGDQRTVARPGRVAPGGGTAPASRRPADVPDEFALAEAEGDLNAADFRASHMEYWTKAGETITDDTMINQIYFTLLTHRLRNLEASDAEWITRACQDEEVQRWTKVPRPYSREHAESFIKDLNGDLAAWAIIDSRSQEPVGMIGIHHVINGVASIGYWVAPWGRKSGAASTALRIIPTLARRIGMAHTLYATIAETNTASRRTAERGGFALIGNSTESCPDGSSVIAGLTYQLQI